MAKTVTTQQVEGRFVGLPAGIRRAEGRAFNRVALAAWCVAFHRMVFAACCG
jgi:hypothetical protein